MRINLDRRYRAFLRVIEREWANGGLTEAAIAFGEGDNDTLRRVFLQEQQIRLAAQENPIQLILLDVPPRYDGKTNNGMY